MSGRARGVAAGTSLLLVMTVLAACAGPAGPAPAAGSGAPAAASGAGAAAAGAAGAAPSGAAAPGAAPASAAGAPKGRDAYPAPDDAETKIKAAWCAVAGAMFPLWVAKDAGIFERHRLDAELVFMQGGTPCVAAMTNGEVDFLESAGGLIAGLMASNDGLVIANLYLGNPYRLIVVPDITRVEDLRGRRLAISRPGEWDYRLNEVMLERHGLRPNEDVTLVPVGGQTDRYNALKAGVVDGTTVNPPVNLAAKNEGFREIFNLNELNFSGVYISLYTGRKTMEQRPRLVERFLAAMVEASAYARANKEFTIDLMSKYLQLNDREALEGAYQAYAAEMLAIPPRVPLDAVQSVIDETLTQNPNVPVRDAAQIVDARPLQAVEASGFVDAVLAAYPAAGGAAPAAPQ
ncbi:MAG TPA: ABC transporter substrate-binding protein [Chloroflexota bacterium]